MDLVTSGLLDEGEHVVSFYDGAEHLTDLVVPYLAAAVREGDTVIVIATPEHRAAFAAALADAGIDVHDALCHMRVRLFDAAEMLSRFMRDGSVHRGAFIDSVGHCVREAVAEGRPVRAYGEMVALLWAEGNRSGAVDLERAWNLLGRELPFSLLCTYPDSVADDPDASAELASVLELHSQVVPVVAS
ncbi:MAG TPA: MEDS domain-containing protein [Acidimicrobiales bacterium]|nr:MEDS domain-containing protein [Acidimicrobiales bacterium]